MILITKKSNKIPLDKYYTSPELAEYIANKTKEVVGEDNITEYIEPSAGAGVFLDYLDKPYLAYDIEPEDSRIIKQDYLELELDYKKGRCIIGNPPYGTRNTLSVRFFKKSIQLGDYISFILPISQLNNNQQMYEFDLIHSEDLGIRSYSEREVHCCFNIYRHPESGKFNKKPNYKLKDVALTEYRSKKKSIESDIIHDYRFCYWGAATGKEVKNKGEYTHEMGVDVFNEDLKDKVIQCLRDVNWYEIIKFTATPAVYQWQVYKYLKEQISELE